MPIVLIQLRGLMLTHRTAANVLLGILALILTICVAYQIWKWRKTGQLPHLAWRILIILICVLDLVAFMLPGVLFLVFYSLSTSPAYPLIWWILLLIGVAATLFLLLHFLIPKLKLKAPRLVLSKKSLSHARSTKKTPPFLKPPKPRSILPFVILSIFICFDFAIKAYFLFGFVFFNYSQSVWPAVYLAADLTSALKVDSNLPHSLAELKTMKPTEVKRIQAHGRLCYFYDPEQNDFTIITQFANLWHLHNREHDRLYLQPKDLNGLIYGPLVESCRKGL